VSVIITSAPAAATAMSVVTVTDLRDRARVRDDVRARLIALRARDPNVHSRHRAREDVRVAHVRFAVAEEAHREPLRRSLVLADRQQVGEELARVEVVAQRVDDGHARALGHLLKARLGVGAPHDRGHLALEDARRVGRRLLTAELARRGRDDQGASAEIGDAHRERDARTRR
jgi:hypothetical protein